ncbi:N-acetyl-gamma-glutamyl-phosphate reductase [Candidatus Kinetoplastibacterium sorsogonicusi]|uniref:N-acetyl-gamma-glutamyl-phosphate reductase n=2 Tax=Candidatus Kinetoplastidibacterium kentomonadis TaxID=1576550 RepID=A0A3S7JAI9_9PROT|nr:N-acetyl-gamma-glutamyl-phosphate reductase [Candidatus Kinetoplastibacterium sorsogonicusi]AWD32688.1 N-acetyl-gamma-glutamyl-phosphate reductase [Candidatus Kinetoplastibacterium sorsogonicusi]
MVEKNKLIKVGIVGGTGYTGIELIRILSQHPYVTISVITSRKEIGEPVSNLYTNLRGHTSLLFSSLDINKLLACDVVFFATPHGIAMNFAKKLIEHNVKVIDLSADFRFKDPLIFQEYYNIEHSCPELLQISEYGIVELNRKSIKSANIIGNPGCYPTTILLGLAPLFKNPNINLVDLNIIADCKSGISGSGRKLEINSLFSEKSENFQAYGLPKHRHKPEIIANFNHLYKKDIDLIFVPHLVPMIRGMFSTIYVKLNKDYIDYNFQNLYEKFYKDEHFIDIMPYSSLPDTKSVKASNKIRISLHKVTNNLLVILVVQDNLVKGAAGQAVQNMNLLFNLPEISGLETVPIFP